jgi:hypothetical protein
MQMIIINFIKSAISFIIQKRSSFNKNWETKEEKNLYCKKVIIYAPCEVLIILIVYYKQGKFSTMPPLVSKCAMRR